MKFPRLASPVALLVSIVLLASCATLGPTPAIGLSVVDVRPRQSSLLETSFDLTLRLANESARPLMLAGSTHKLYVNDTYVGRAVSDERLTVPAFGTITPMVTVFLENLTLLRKATEFSQAPKLAYRLESRLHPVDGSVMGDITATANGEIDVAGLSIMLAPPGR